MALKSESASQMDHLQALEKVSPKLEVFPVLFALHLNVLKSPFSFIFTFIWDKKIIMEQWNDQTRVVKIVDSIDYE